MSNTLILIIIAVILGILITALIHWLILRRQCLHKHLIRSRSIHPIKENQYIWHIKFSPGKVLGLFPCFVFWQKYYPSGKGKYKVSGNYNWVYGKIKEVEDNQTKIK